ncbi:hypothetical protein GGX14DRAFT_647773 [Mycena pura]|uniref:Uncharacterized protein n=1 Tax=Mycena pura TaxID=153505 RepID=A0AAD6YDM7_9AGAR|nr:hypothetical protein GGX14DRAFT_647773 [Mycena pura]
MRINAAFVLLAWLLVSPGVFGAPMEERAKAGAAAKPPAKAPPAPPPKPPPPPPPTNKAPAPTNKAPAPTTKTPPPATSKPVVPVSKPAATTRSAVTTKSIPSSRLGSKVISAPISSSVMVSSTTTGPVSKPAAPSVVTAKSSSIVQCTGISKTGFGMSRFSNGTTHPAHSSGPSSSALSSGGKAPVSLTSAIVTSASIPASTGLPSGMSSVPLSTGPGSASAVSASDVASAISASSVPDSAVSASASISASDSAFASGLSATSVSASVSSTPAVSDSGSASAPAASGSGSGGSASGSASASATAPAVPSEIPGPPRQACPAPGSFPPPASASASSASASASSASASESSASAPSAGAPSASAPSASALSVRRRVHPRALVSRASCTDTVSCAEKGKELFTKTTAATADTPSAKTGDLYAASYAPHATPTTLNTQTGVGRQIFALFTKLRNSGVRLPPLQKPLLAESALQQQVEVSIPGKTAGQFAFDNAYAPGVIVGLNNFREEDSVAQGSQVGWNVVAFEQYKAFRGASPPSDLRFVMRFHIDNAVTIQVLKDVYNTHGLSDQATQDDTEWTRWAVDDENCGNDVVMALLGTDNGKGAAFLLIDYKTSVGNKNIVAIYTRRQEGLWAFVVEYA